ncbi:hypothetical protein LCGC14_2338150 [marine sediment metagenome]|uniref:Uncharacterized protein n=1 Tax=marine sediment metagenome TaxID=412755 RepID=A0A0F9CCQ0_9ZZZZ
MKKYIAILILVAMTWALFGCAHQDEWTSQDTKFQIAVTIAMAADGYTSSKIQYTEGMQEVGLIAKHFLGPQPSTSDVWMYTGTLMISSYFISRALPSKWRPYWQVFLITDHGTAAITNCQQDLGC